MGESDRRRLNALLAEAARNTGGRPVEPDVSRETPTSAPEATAPGLREAVESRPPPPGPTAHQIATAIPEESTTLAERYRALASLVRDRARELPNRAKAEREALTSQAREHDRLAIAAETVDETIQRHRRLAAHERQEGSCLASEAYHCRQMAKHYDRIAAELETIGGDTKMTITWTVDVLGIETGVRDGLKLEIRPSPSSAHRGAFNLSVFMEREPPHAGLGRYTVGVFHDPIVAKAAAEAMKLDRQSVLRAAGMPFAPGKWNPPDDGVQPRG